MLEQVENKIIELKKLQAEEYYRKKDADLQAWGLTHKTEGNKVTPIIVTDDEYEALIKASSGVDRIGRNSYSKVLTVLAYVAVGVGAASGSVIAALAENLNFVYFSLCIIAGFVLAVIFKSLSEVIRLLQQIIDEKPNLKPEGAVPPQPKTAPKAAKVQPQPQPQPQPQAAPVYPQVHIQPQGQPVYQPVYTQVPLQGGPAVFSQQPPVYVYSQQPAQPVQPQPTRPQETGIHYGEQK